MTDKEKKKLHRKTIKNHRKYVRKMCFKMGIPWLGLLHDRSKFSKEEFEIYKYYVGTYSPHDAARKTLGYSPSWIYHKAKNKHHWEYWFDFNSVTSNEDGTFSAIGRPVKMPYKYVIEMFCDFIGAGMAYSKDTWTTQAPLNYWKEHASKRALHPDSKALFEQLLVNLSKYNNLNDFVKWYKTIKPYYKRTYTSWVE